MEKYDFSGWATRNDLLCVDGRTIKKDAFKNQNGKTVPLVWGHTHSDPNRVLGHAVLENRDEGVYAYCSFNDSESGLAAKKLVKHGDVRSLSICAGQLKQAGANVVHGVIYELSLVLAGANPGAFIDSVMEHGDASEDRMIIGYDENIMIYHSADEKEEKSETQEGKTSEEKTEEDEETVEQIFDTLSEKQKNVIYAMFGQAFGEPDKPEDKNDDSKGGKTEMKHNVFDNEKKNETGGFLAHSAQEDIIKMAKTSQVGTFQTALEIYAEQNGFQHDAVSGGFVQAGEGNVTALFPEYQEVRPGAPELITNDQGWISNVMRKVHKSPISRIRTSQTDIRGIDSLRARGYKKGKEKKQAGNFKLVRRTTDPQTVYVKNTFNKLEYRNIPESKLTGEKWMEKSVNIGDQLSQVIGIYYPYRIDNYVKYVRSQKFYGRYMDDWYIMNPSKEELLDLLDHIHQIAEEYGIHINRKKTRIVKISSTYKFLQIKYSLTDSGKVIKRINPKRVTAMRRKLKRLAVKVKNEEISYENVENMFRSWMGGFYKLLSKEQRKNLIGLYEDLFEKSIEIVNKKMIIVDKTR